MGTCARLGVSLALRSPFREVAWVDYVLGGCTREHRTQQCSAFFVFSWMVHTVLRAEGWGGLRGEGGAAMLSEMALMSGQLQGWGEWSEDGNSCDMSTKQPTRAGAASGRDAGIFIIDEGFLSSSTRFSRNSAF